MHLDLNIATGSKNADGYRFIDLIVPEDNANTDHTTKTHTPKTAPASRKAYDKSFGAPRITSASLYASLVCASYLQAQDNKCKIASEVLKEVFYKDLIKGVMTSSELRTYKDNTYDVVHGVDHDLHDGLYSQTKDRRHLQKGRPETYTIDFNMKRSAKAHLEAILSNNNPNKVRTMFIFAADLSHKDEVELHITPPDGQERNYVIAFQRYIGASRRYSNPSIAVAVLANTNHNQERIARQYHWDI